jgi:hypothetical protein
MDTKQEQDTQKSLADMADQVSDAATRAVSRVPEVVDQMPEVAHRVSDEVGSFMRHKRWVPVLAVATLGLATVVVMMARVRHAA